MILQRHKADQATPLVKILPFHSESKPRTSQQCSAFDHKWALSSLSLHLLQSQLLVSDSPALSLGLASNIPGKSIHGAFALDAPFAQTGLSTDTHTVSTFSFKSSCTCHFLKKAPSSPFHLQFWAVPILLQVGVEDVTYSALLLFPFQWHLWPSSLLWNLLLIMLFM